jgi:NAD(P)-dependent dehydrogenase (short-subunit alcohol dehydrogenase family)
LALRPCACSRPIGAAVAFTYAASDEKAAALVAEIEAGGGEALAIKADSADPKALQRAVTETVNRFGHLDILVNNAGILLRGAIDAFSLDDFDRMLAVNVRAVFVGLQAAVAYMGEGGRIITIGSGRSQRLSRRVGLQHDQSGSRGAHPGHGARSGTTRHYRQYDAARADRD